MKKGLLFFIFLLFTLTPLKGYGQCTESLNQAQEAFDNGHLYGIPALLSDCVDRGSKQDKIEAYRLLTLTYLYIDDPIAAQNSFMSLLKLDPEYRVDSTNQIELVHLSKEYITTPIVSWSAGGGANISNVTVLHKNGGNNTEIDNERYDWAVGGTIIGAFELHFGKFVSFKAESELSFNRFKYHNNYFNIIDEQNSKDDVNLIEKSWNYSLPVSIKLTYPGNIYYPYIYGGYAPTYNVITNTDAVLINNQNSAEIRTEDKNLDISRIRTDFSHSYIVGIGVKRRIKYHFVFIDVRYKIGMYNRLVREEQNSFEADPGINKYTNTYLQQDNDFRQNEVTITAGYVWPRYKPRKRKSVTAKYFLGNLFKKKGKDE
jgi:hypothetical protein